MGAELSTAANDNYQKFNNKQLDISDSNCYISTFLLGLPEYLKGWKENKSFQYQEEKDTGIAVRDKWITYIGNKIKADTPLMVEDMANQNGYYILTEYGKEIAVLYEDFMREKKAKVEEATNEVREKAKKASGL